MGSFFGENSYGNFSLTHNMGFIWDFIWAFTCLFANSLFEKKIFFRHRSVIQKIFRNQKGAKSSVCMVSEGTTRAVLQLADHPGCGVLATSTRGKQKKPKT